MITAALEGKLDLTQEFAIGAKNLIAGAKQATWQQCAMTGALAVVAVASCLLIDRVKD